MEICGCGDSGERFELKVVVSTPSMEVEEMIMESERIKRIESFGEDSILTTEGERRIVDVKEREKVGGIYIGNLETVMVARDGSVASGIGRGRANECCVELLVS